MDYKAIVLDQLRNLRDSRIAVRNLRNRARLERSRAASLTSCATQDVRVSGGKPSDMVLSAIATADMSERQADYIAAQVDELNNALCNLPDDLRSVLQLMEVEGLSADEVLDRVHLERRAIYYKRDRALEQLARIMWGAVVS